MGKRMIYCVIIKTVSECLGNTERNSNWHLMWFLINTVLIKIGKAIKWNGTQVRKIAINMWNKEQ